MKKNLFIIILFFTMLSAGFASATAPLEVQYPDISVGSFSTGAPNPDSLPIYARYFLVFLIACSGFAALFVFTKGGFDFITSVGDSGKTSEARKSMTSAALGLLIVLSYFIILYTINPTLVLFDINMISTVYLERLTPGVYLCVKDVDIPHAYTLEGINEPNKDDKERNAKIIKDANENCLIVSSSRDNLGNFNEKVKYVYLVPDPSMGTKYGVILSNKTGKNVNDPQARAAIFFSDKNINKVTYFPLSKIQPYSAIPFILHFNPSFSSSVILYNFVNYNEKDEGAEKFIIKDSQISGVSARFSNINLPLPDDGETGQYPEINSIRVEPSKSLIAIFFKEQSSSWTDATDIDIYLENNPDLNGSRVGKCLQDNAKCEKYKYSEDLPDEMESYPCAPGGIVVVKASTF